METNATRVIVVDTHPIVREGLRQFLEVNGTSRVVAEAGNGETALKACDHNPHDVVMISSVLPGADVFQIIRSLKAAHSDSHVVVCYIDANTHLIQDFRRCGTDGFIGQHASSGEYAAAVMAVMQGGNFLSSNLTDTIFQLTRNEGERSNAYGLTGRELEILSMLASGLCNKEIANEFDLSVRTVETHRFNIRRKTASNTLSDLVRVARSLGLSSLSGPPIVSAPPMIPEKA